MHYRNFVYEKVLRPLLLRNKLLNPLITELSHASSFSSTNVMDIFARLNSSRINPATYVAEFQKLSSNLELRRGSLKLAYPKKFDTAEELCLLIYLTTRTFQPNTVLETGVGNGVSTYYILNAMRKNNKGTLYSTDIAYDVGNLLTSDEKERWNLKIFNKRTIDKNFANLLLELPSIDVFIHDSDHTFDGQMAEYKPVFPRLNKSGLFFSDDIDLSYAFLRFCEEIQVKPLVLVTRHKVSGIFQKS